MTQPYKPKHNNPLKWAYEDRLLEDISHEELADLFLSAKDDVTKQGRINMELSKKQVDKNLLHAIEIRNWKEETAKWLILVALLAGGVGVLIGMQL